MTLRKHVVPQSEVITHPRTTQRIRAGAVAVSVVHVRSEGHEGQKTDAARCTAVSFVFLRTKKKHIAREEGKEEELTPVEKNWCGSRKERTTEITTKKA